MKMEYPRKFQIGFQEGTCPLKCKKCLAFGTGVGREKEVMKMPIDKAERLIDEIAGFGNQAVIQPHIFTEPFANLDLKRIIRYCGKRKLAMSIITNGVLLNDDWIDFLLSQTEQSITVSFSLDALTQNTYEKVRGNYELLSIEKKINYLLGNRQKQNLRIGVNFTVEEDNKAEKDDFLEKWKFQADAVRIHQLIDRNMKMMSTFPKEEDRECESLNETMVIDAGGEVRACSLDAFGDSYIGNVFEKGILNIWNGDKMESLRESISHNTLSENEFCYRCGVRGYAGKYICRETEDFYMVDNGYDFFYNHKWVNGER